MPVQSVASYWSVEAGGEHFPDLAWTYPRPVPESLRIAGLVCFYNERVDLLVDGVRQDRPKTHFA